MLMLKPETPFLAPDTLEVMRVALKKKQLKNVIQRVLGFVRGDSILKS